METVFLNTGSWLGLLGSVVLIAVSHVVKKCVLPFLSVGERHKYATYIATIADEVTDSLRTKYPEKKWLAHLDEAVDRLIEICGVSRDIAYRAVQAAIARK